MVFSSLRQPLGYGGKGGGDGLLRRMGKECSSLWYSLNLKRKQGFTSFFLRKNVPRKKGIFLICFVDFYRRPILRRGQAKHEAHNNKAQDGKTTEHEDKQQTNR